MYTSSSTENSQSCIRIEICSKQQRSKNPMESERGSGTHNHGNKQSKETYRYDHPKVGLSELGPKSWVLLHTMATTYPVNPTDENKRDITEFFNIMSRLFPCKKCRDHLADELKEEPVKANSRHELEQWLCRLHNKVNERTEKAHFDCSRVKDRWDVVWKVKDN